MPRTVTIGISSCFNKQNFRYILNLRSTLKRWNLRCFMEGKYNVLAYDLNSKTLMIFKMITHSLL